MISTALASTVWRRAVLLSPTAAGTQDSILIISSIFIGDSIEQPFNANMSFLRFRVWTIKGKKKLHEFLADMG